jgi:hypothetical protein
MAVWIMVVMFCPGYLDGPGRCRTEIVPGSFPSQQRCKEVGGLLKHKGVTTSACRSGKRQPDRGRP